MITNHFKALAASLLFNAGTSGLYGMYEYKTVAGTTKYACGYTITATKMDIAASTGASAGIHFGSGTTTPTAADYGIETEVQVSATVTGTTFTKTTNGWQKSVDITLTNTGESAVTIAEVAFYGSIRGAASEGGTSAANSDLIVMFDRTLLDTPITIPAGSAATMTYALGTELAAS